MHLIPRRCENFVIPESEDVISINALGFAGMLLVKTDEELEKVKGHGVGLILHEVGLESVHEIQLAGTTDEAVNLVTSHIWKMVYTWWITRNILPPSRRLFRYSPSIRYFQHTDAFVSFTLDTYVLQCLSPPGTLNGLMKLLTINRRGWRFIWVKPLFQIFCNPCSSIFISSQIIGFSIYFRKTRTHGKSSVSRSAATRLCFRRNK